MADAANTDMAPRSKKAENKGQSQPGQKAASPAKPGSPQPRTSSRSPAPEPITDTKRLVEVLEEWALRPSRDGVNKHVYKAVGHPEIELTRWKFQDSQYYKNDLPVRSRGLFTVGERIAVRGYDKFFNVNEVPSTRWDVLAETTTGPYQVTLKHNGSLSLIAGVDGKLVVTSKNASTEDPSDKGLPSHSSAGLGWVRRHLAAAGRSEAELAAELERAGVTAVGELCDDEFDEHVLSYSQHDAGIYLTGVNRNEAVFATWEPDAVNALAAKYGLHTNRYLTFATLEETRAFLEERAESGTFENKEVEGFVVRCTSTATGRAFFFKYKFEEPYLMYRQWREVTAPIVNGKPIPAIKALHRDSTARYMEFLKTYLPAHPEVVARVRAGRGGLLELRKRFVEQSGMTEEQLLALAAAAPALPLRLVVTTVATLGVGKTTVSLALSELAGWPLVQNDDLPKDKKKERFPQRAAELLESTGAVGVIMDKNNHERRERQELLSGMRLMPLAWTHDLRFVILNFLPEGPTAATRKLTRERVAKRSGNHQTIREMPLQQVYAIMGGFEKRFQVVDPLHTPDSEFDTVVNLDATAGSRANLLAAIAALNAKYGLQIPSDDASVDAALARALAYKATVPQGGGTDHKQRAQKKPKAPKPQYFALELDPEAAAALPSQVDAAFRAAGAVPDVWRRLQAGEGTLQQAFHVTIAHRKHKARYEELKAEFKAVLATATPPEAEAAAQPATEAAPDADGFVVVGAVGIWRRALGVSADVEITDLSWNANSVALRVRVAKPAPANGEHAHITIGYLPPARAVDSNAMLKGEHSALAWPGPRVLTAQPLQAVYEFR